jgi:hypothetical protein
MPRVGALEKSIFNGPSFFSIFLSRQLRPTEDPWAN